MTRRSRPLDVDRLAATISGRGIRSVSGRVLGDESFYDRERGAAGWKRHFVGMETPPLSALVVDRAQGWPALSPPLLAARAFRDALVRRGVSVSGRPGLGLAPAAAVSLASDVSDPLAQIIQRMNHESDNFYAEMLLKQLLAATGKVGTSAGAAGSSSQQCVTPASRPAASGWSTARGSRASTA